MTANDKMCGVAGISAMSVIGRGLDNGVSSNIILYPEAVVALKLTFTWKLCFCNRGA
jgi:hypothetical protein